MGCSLSRAFHLNITMMGFRLKVSPSSSSLRTTLARSLGGRARSCFCTAGSMSRDFFKGLLQIVRQRNELAGAAGRFDPLVIGPNKRLQIGLGHAIFPPGIVGR